MKQQVQEIQQNPSTRNMKKTILHIIIKLFQTSDKKKIFKVVKKKKTHYVHRKIRMTSDFSLETK